MSKLYPEAFAEPRATGNIVLSSPTGRGCETSEKYETDTARCRAVQYRTAPCGTGRRHAVPHGAIWRRAVPSDAARHRTVPHRTARHYLTIPHGTVWHRPYGTALGHHTRPPHYIKKSTLFCQSAAAELMRHRHVGTQTFHRKPKENGQRRCKLSKQACTCHQMWGNAPVCQ